MNILRFSIVYGQSASVPSQGFASFRTLTQDLEIYIGPAHSEYFNTRPDISGASRLEQNRIVQPLHSSPLYLKSLGHISVLAFFTIRPNAGEDITSNLRPHPQCYINDKPVS